MKVYPFEPKALLPLRLILPLTRRSHISVLVQLFSGGCLFGIGIRIHHNFGAGVGTHFAHYFDGIQPNLHGVSPFFGFPAPTIPGAGNVRFKMFLKLR